MSTNKTDNNSNRISYFYCTTIFILSFRILALEKLGAVFNQIATPLKFTPRKFVIHSPSNNLVVIETDHNAYTDRSKEEKKQQLAEVKGCSIHSSCYLQ